MKLKSSLYKGLRVSNDVNAIKRGKVGKRLARRAIGRITGKAMRKLIR